MTRTAQDAERREWRNIPRQNGSGACCSAGTLYCAACGRRMTSSSPRRGGKAPLKPSTSATWAPTTDIACTGPNAPMWPSAWKISCCGRPGLLLEHHPGHSPRTNPSRGPGTGRGKRAWSVMIGAHPQTGRSRTLPKQQEALEMEVSPAACWDRVKFTTAEMLSRADR